MTMTRSKGKMPKCTSAILFFIISSRQAVTSSVITGAGLTLCSKSRSTSRALFLGLLEAVTYTKRLIILFTIQMVTMYCQRDDRSQKSKWFQKV
jgi:hypothetical protein